jgi:hypothetical protein
MIFCSKELRSQRVYGSLRPALPYPLECSFGTTPGTAPGTAIPYIRGRLRVNEQGCYLA